MSDRVHLAAAIGAEVIFWGSIILAVALKSFYALLLIPAGYGIGLIVVGRFAQLTPITNNEVRAERRSSLRFILVMIVFAVTGYLLFGRK